MPKVKRLNSYLKTEIKRVRSSTFAMSKYIPSNNQEIGTAYSFVIGAPPKRVFQTKILI